MGFEQIKRNYNRGLWSKMMVNVAVQKGVITSAQYEEITGDPYSPYIPAGTSLEDYKAAKIAESKGVLAEFLEEHPLTYTDGNQYSVTAEKQSLLTSALARYQIAVAAGQTPALKWNATGQECTEWTYENLAALALSIAAYVEPLVAQQQAIEVQIRSCETIEAVKAVNISYAVAS